MKIMKFEGTTMRDALTKVKAELGDQAVIVSSREIRKGLLGTGIEVSAAIDEDEAAWRGAPATPPAPVGQRSEEEVGKLLAPLRQELRSLRALVRAAGDNRATNEMRSELALLRTLVEGMGRAPQGSVPVEPSKNTTFINDRSACVTASSKAKIVMLVGPTGAGKTTTIAKLAARAALIDERRVRMITLDTYRVGGVEQIRMYADMIGIPLDVCDNPADLVETIDESAELTLIDTAGRSPKDIEAIADLAAGIANIPVEVHLVIPAGSSPEIVDELVNRYRSLHPKRFLFTKIDEVTRAPELAQAPARHGLPVTWITTGQAVPEDIEEPNRARILELAGNATRITRAA
jgi:flagellar biosynthesis protein FlhF